MNTRCIALWLMVASTACGSEPAVPAEPTFRFGEASAANDQGEVLVLHADGSLEYRPAEGVIRGRLRDGEILDEHGVVVATYDDDGRIVVRDPIWAVEQRVEEDGTYTIRGATLWQLAPNGDTVETTTGEVILRTSSVPIELRREMMLAQVAFAQLFRHAQMQAAGVDD
jgi:hypothetical protein